MQLAMLLPLALGAIGILQGALNRIMSNNIGMSWMLIIGNIITLLVCLAFFLIVKTQPQLFPDFVKVKELSFKWWYLIPGIFGFLFVAGLPLAIYKLGAVKVTVGMIAAQMMTSVFWDIYVEGIPFSVNKGVGIIFAIMSVVMITFFK